MTDFFDWLTAADSGLGTDRLRERFRLSEAEMRRVTEALAPAFLLGLQRLSVDPSAWSDFLGRMPPWAPGDAANPMAKASKDFLDRLFAAGPGTDSIARQASLMAGIAPGTIADMMPELAMMTVRTMMRMAGSAGSMPFARELPGDAGGLAMAEMMRRSANAVEAFSKPSSQGASAPAPTHHAYLETLFSDALKGGFPWMGAGGPTPPAKTPTPTDGTRTDGVGGGAASPFFAFAPLLDAFATVGDSKTGESNGQASAPPERAAEATPVDPIAAMTRAMETGRSLQETYAQEMLAFFDRQRRGD